MESSFQPELLTNTETIPAVWGVLKPSDFPGSNPGVLILHGASGWKDTYAEIAESLSHSGFTTLAVDYLHETGYENSPAHIKENWSNWQGIIRNAVTYLLAQPSVAGSPIGLVGYSLGAFLSISLASSLPNVKAVVDFFGGGSNDMNTLQEQSRNFPPLLILHGKSDKVVPVIQAYRLQEAVVKQGGQVEMHIYPGADQGFNAPWSPHFSADASTDSYLRMVTFLEKYLKK
jgi:carboxymethylenebutenolidase